MKAKRKRLIKLVVHGPDRPPVHPPRTVWDLFYFVHGTSLTMKNGCHHHQNGMDYLYDVISKMAAGEIGKFHIFTYLSF